MTSRKVKAIILARKNIGEADRLLTALSLDEGKIKIIAKGSRKIKSKMAGHIEPFSIGEYYLIEGKTFYILAGAEIQNEPPNLEKDIELYKDLSYVCEITEMLVENESVEPIFHLLSQTLTTLPGLDAPKRESIIHFFELNLLSLLGYEPDYKKCKKCGQDLTEEDNYFGRFEGFCCHDCGKEGVRVDKNTLKALRLFTTSSLEEVSKINGLEAINSSLKEVIYPYICDILPRQPKSYTL